MHWAIQEVADAEALGNDHPALQDWTVAAGGNGRAVSTSSETL